MDTVTAQEQERVEKLVFETYGEARQLAGGTDGSVFDPSEAGAFNFAECVPLMRRDHVAYVRAGLERLGAGFSSLDASRPWLCYWIVHSLELLGAPPDASVCARMVDFLGGRCQDESGGFAGGPGQLPHLAPTYAAVNALSTLGTPEAYRCIRRPQLYAFLLRLKNPDGSFSLHAGGESDVRGTYTAVAVAKLTCVADETLFAGTAEWIARCQAFEGGLGGEPGNEAHGGYTFCGVAALELLGAAELLNQPRLLRWLAKRQMALEGGFQGRTNKLVDSCYSFWQAAVPAVLGAGDAAMAAPDDETTQWFDRQRLQQWLLCCCQDPRGGLRDKPDRPRDFYHTCYALSGLSLAQHGWHGRQQQEQVVGPAANLVPAVDPCYNVSAIKVRQARRFFGTNQGGGH